MRRRALCLVAGLVAVVGLGWWLSPAAGASGWAVAQAGGERIVSFEADLRVNRDASLSVTESITYDFGGQRRRGIKRFLPTRFPYEPPDGATGRFERLTPISEVRVTSPTGAPAELQVTEENGWTEIRIGDPDRTITGIHTYLIRYTIRGVYNRFPDHDELYWNVTGDRWEVPMGSVSARVSSPAPIDRQTCFAGPTGSTTPCDEGTADGSVATFRQSDLRAGSGLTVVVAMPVGTIDDPSPIIEELWSPQRAFGGGVAPVAAGAGILAAGVAGISALVYRHGRDRRFAGSAVDAAFGSPTGEDQRVPLFDREQHPVEFVPPEGIRPGHLGTLWDEVAHPLDVSAMIVDLAVRGYLRIDELEPPASGVLGIGRREGDYQFVKLREPDDDLLRAEQTLLQGLFRDGSTVKLSELRQNFASRLELVQDALYDDAVALGWFPTRPDRVRNRWHLIGIAALIVGSGLAFLLIRFTSWGFAAIPLPLLGLLLLVLGGRFPHRTAKGTALLGRVKGFRELFAAGEGERQRFAEQHHLFSQYLPYAIVFGMADRWARTFEPLGLTPEEMGIGVWYTSPYGYNPVSFGSAMNSFSTVTTGSIAAATPSSSGGSGFGGGGFSGGGFGGGGGGSW